MLVLCSAWVVTLWVLHGRLCSSILNVVRQGHPRFLRRSRQVSGTHHFEKDIWPPLRLGQSVLVSLVEQSRDDCKSLRICICQLAKLASIRRLVAAEPCLRSAFCRGGPSSRQLAKDEESAGLHCCTK